MYNVQPCDPYRAVVRERKLWRSRDGKSAFKVYFLDIVGREDPTRTEWDKCPMTPDQFLERLDDTDGVGFITAFPHITKVFRYGPARETILNVRACLTPDMAPMDLTEGEGYVQFACLAEALIAGEEYAFWAESESVAEHLEDWAGFDDGAILRHDKLGKYWRAGD